MMEALITLAILSLVTAVVAASIARPSDRLRLESKAAELKRDAGLRRLEAVRWGERIVFEPEGDEIVSCDGEAAPRLIFKPNGGGLGGPICLARGDHAIRLELDWLTGRLKEVAP